MCHGIPWGVPWDPGVGTMGAPWVGSLSLLGFKGPLGLLDPWASLDLRASWHPREPRGQWSWRGCGALTDSEPPTALRLEPPGRSPPIGVGKPRPLHTACPILPYPSFALSFPVLTFRLCFARCPGFSCPSNVILGNAWKGFPVLQK